MVALPSPKLARDGLVVDFSFSLVDSFAAGASDIALETDILVFYPPITVARLKAASFDLRAFIMACFISSCFLASALAVKSFL